MKISYTFEHDSTIKGSIESTTVHGIKSQLGKLIRDTAIAHGETVKLIANIKDGKKSHVLTCESKGRFNKWVMDPESK